MILDNRKKIFAGIICFILLSGLVYSSTVSKTYAFTFNDCECVLESVTIGNSDGTYTNRDQSYYIDKGVTEFAITSMSCIVASNGALSGGALMPDYHYYDGDPNNIRPQVHPIKVSYSFDDNTYQELFRYSKDGNWYDQSVDIGTASDLYLKFVLLNKNGEPDILAKKIHITRDSAPSVTSITAEPSELSSTGGKVKIDVTGENLPSNLDVRAYGSDNEDTGIISSSGGSDSKSVMVVTSTYGSFTLDFPENDTDVNKTYIVRATQNGDPFATSTKVTVLAKADSDDNDENDGGINNDSKDKNDPAGGKTADETDLFAAVALGLTAMLGIFITLLVLEIRRKQFFRG